VAVILSGVVARVRVGGLVQDRVVAGIRWPTRETGRGWSLVHVSPAVADPQWEEVDAFGNASFEVDEVHDVADLRQRQSRAVRLAPHAGWSSVPVFAFHQGVVCLICKWPTLASPGVATVRDLTSGGEARVDFAELHILVPGTKVELRDAGAFDRAIVNAINDDVVELEVVATGTTLFRSLSQRGEAFDRPVKFSRSAEVEYDPVHVGALVMVPDQRRSGRWRFGVVSIEEYNSRIAVLVAADSGDSGPDKRRIDASPPTSPVGLSTVTVPKWHVRRLRQGSHCFFDCFDGVQRTVSITRLSNARSGRPLNCELHFRFSDLRPGARVPFRFWRPQEPASFAWTGPGPLQNATRSSFVGVPAERDVL